MVRAKFRVVSVEPNGDSNVIKLSAVYGDGNPENAEFFKWTPSGEITIGCANPAATAAFVPGMEMYVDFTPVPKA
jgi:hypothetical protein